MKNYTDNKIKEGLKVMDYELARYKLYNPDSYDKLIGQLQIARGKVFTIKSYTIFIKRGRG